MSGDIREYVETGPILHQGKNSSRSAVDSQKITIPVSGGDLDVSMSQSNVNGLDISMKQDTESAENNEEQDMSIAHATSELDESMTSTLATVKGQTEAKKGIVNVDAEGKVEEDGEETVDKLTSSTSTESLKLYFKK